MMSNLVTGIVTTLELIAICWVVYEIIKERG